MTPKIALQLYSVRDVITQKNYETVVRQVAQSLEISQLAKYAFQLAQKFNLFYHRYHILSEPDPARKRNLLLVTNLVCRQLEKAMELLGCRIPPKM